LIASNDSKRQEWPLAALQDTTVTQEITTPLQDAAYVPLPVMNL